MADQASALHPHRLKMDGSSDLICLNCLATVTSSDDADLADTKAHHICSPHFSTRRTSTLQH
jgi:hypothetical protein